MKMSCRFGQLINTRQQSCFLKQLYFQSLQTDNITMIRGIKFITLLLLAIICLTVVHAEDVEAIRQTTQTQEEVQLQVDTSQADIQVQHEHEEGTEGEEVEYLDQDAQGYQQAEEGQHVDVFAQYTKEADANQDDQITLQELHNFFVSFIVLDEVENVGEYVKTYFQMLDTDKDEHLSKEEFRALLETAESAEAEEYGGEVGQDGQAVYQGEQVQQGEQVEENEEDL